MLWWRQHAHQFSEVKYPENLDDRFLQLYCKPGETCIYHPHEWEQAIILGEQFACVLGLYHQFCQSASEEYVEIEKLVFFSNWIRLGPDTVDLLKLFDNPPKDQELSAKRAKTNSHQIKKIRPGYEGCWKPE